MSGSSVSIGIGAAALNPSPLYHRIHGEQAHAPVLGTISGRITNSATGRGLGPIRVQLIDASGDVVQTTVSNCKGNYRFRIREDGPYVVRQVTPRRFTQTSPTFADIPPAGSYAIDPATGKPYTSASFSYITGNDNPAFGPVGVYAWDTVAPAGELPFESPINITVPPIDLSPYLSVNFQSAKPTQIVNNGYQIQVQYAGSSSDTLTLGGVHYELAQFHFHDPSESTVNSHGYSMEVHFVSESEAGAETVIAVFYQVGAYNPALQPVLDAATASLTEPGSSTIVDNPIDLNGLLPTNADGTVNLNGWFYEGSLTTPALAQPVNWVVLSTPITLSYAQLKQYEAVARGAGFLPNNRPTQPLDGRQVNEFNFDVNFQGSSVGGLNFSNTPIVRG
ncbi:MAG: carbonic anhydrase family protein [Isosphaeraceae bacterium]|nr:carbonic anhydrase family protein [Isosphaeraceae bacterium]